MSHLSPDQIDRVAALARLTLAPGQRERLAADLERILDYVDQLTAVPTDGVSATAHVHDVPRARRADDVRPSLSVEEALANAPDADVRAGVFRVPRVVGG
jgi:aspartyl-tRNA(Asn)/glutamyl-tRNA(Gln) amidotransferase subunit C